MPIARSRLLRALRTFLLRRLCDGEGALRPRFSRHVPQRWHARIEATWRCLRDGGHAADLAAAAIARLADLEPALVGLVDRLRTSTIPVFPPDRRDAATAVWHAAFAALDRRPEQLIFVSSADRMEAAARRHADPARATLLVATDDAAEFRAAWWVAGTLRPAFRVPNRYLADVHRAELVSWFVQATQPRRVIGHDGHAFRTAIERQGVALAEICTIVDAGTPERAPVPPPPPVAATARPIADPPPPPPPPRADVDVTVVVTAHREGRTIEPSLASARRALDRAGDRGLRGEMVVVLDRADPETHDLVHRLAAADAPIVVVDHGDVGLSRNAGARAASGRWIAFLDGDDLFDDNWLAAAHAAAVADPRPTVWHPEVNLYFPHDPRLWLQGDMDDPDLRLAGLVCSNYWSSLCFVARSLVLAVPYRRTEISRGFAYEDWAWNREVIVRGAIHKMVPAAVHFVRVKDQGSLLRASDARLGMAPPSELFPGLLTTAATARN